MTVVWGAKQANELSDGATGDGYSSDQIIEAMGEPGPPITGRVHHQLRVVRFVGFLGLADCSFAAALFAGVDSFAVASSGVWHWRSALTVSARLSARASRGRRHGTA